MDTGKINPKTEGLSWIYLGVCRGIIVDDSGQNHDEAKERLSPKAHELSRYLWRLHWKLWGADIVVKI
jgi:hypothetical protein